MLKTRNMDENQKFWSEKYKSGETGWDVGRPTPPITEYFDQLTSKTSKILIPGAGNAHEAAYLHDLGFQNLYVCDIAEEPLQEFAKQVPTFPQERLLCMDYFKLEATFDIIIEQTFFCALPPTLRSAYIQKHHSLLATDGILVGVLFDKKFAKEGPPFGGTKQEYIELMAPYFNIEIMSPCHNSIGPRLGSELFIKLVKRDQE